jgi:hypothetical protein
MRCIGIEKLLEMSRGQTSQTEAMKMNQHLAGCTRCQGNLDWISTVARLAAADDAVDPPRWVVRQVVALFEEYHPVREPGRLRKLVASLVFDTFAQPQLSGVRSTGLATRQCLYRYSDYDVDLSFEPVNGSDRVNLSGQVLGPSEDFENVGGAKVELMQAAGVVHETVTNHLGEFTFDQVAKGVYELTIQLSDGEVRITQLEVKAGKD